MAPAGRPDGDVIERPDGAVETRTRPAVKKPSMFEVVLLNDDYTPAEFVVLVLMRVFARSQEEAVAVMLEAHVRGTGTCGTYTLEIAETKIREAASLSRAEGFPLRFDLRELGA